MKVRKGRRRYVTFINSYTKNIILTRFGSDYDVSMDVYLPSYICTFDEAKQNLKLAYKKGYTLIKK